MCMSFPKVFITTPPKGDHLNGFESLFSSIALLATGSASSSLFVISGSVARVSTSPSFPLHHWSITNCKCIYTWWGSYSFHSGWPQLCFTSKECPRCTRHLAIMLLEPLIIVVDSSASSATLVFMHIQQPFQESWYPLLSLACWPWQGTMVWPSVCTTNYLEPYVRVYVIVGDPVFLFTSMISNWQGYKGTTPNKPHYCYIGSAVWFLGLSRCIGSHMYFRGAPQYTMLIFGLSGLCTLRCNISKRCDYCIQCIYLFIMTIYFYYYNTMHRYINTHLSV